MVMFQSEADLLSALEEHDDLVRQCIRGDLSFEEFCDKYNDFYSYWALDGHESDEVERQLLEKHNSRIEPHRFIAYEILGKVCSDEDSKLESYKQAGRFGSGEALKAEKCRTLGLTSIDADVLSADFRWHTARRSFLRYVSGVEPT